MNITDLITDRMHENLNPRDISEFEKYRWLVEMIATEHHTNQAKNNEVLDLVSKRLLADTDVEYDHPTGLIKGKLMYDDDEFTTLILKHEGGIINLPDLDKCIVC